MDHDESLYLPPGFRFHPTDEEIVTYYLLEKIADQSFSSFAVAEANFNDCEPWDLPRKANMGEKEWFFFCKKDRKYPTGMRTNRATESGYWKATGKDKEIYKGVGILVGMKKTLVFYMGRAPRGQKSNWVMHEYRLEGKHQQHNSISGSQQHEWVVCKVYRKSKGTNTSPATQEISETSFVDDFFAENHSLLPPLMNSPFFNSDNREVEETKELNQPIFFPQTHQLQAPFSFNCEEEMMRARLISDQALFYMRGQVSSEKQSSNSDACASQATGLGSEEREAEGFSCVSMDQINCVSGLQYLDFDSTIKYEYV